MYYYYIYVYLLGKGRGGNMYCGAPLKLEETGAFPSCVLSRMLISKYV